MWYENISIENLPKYLTLNIGNGIICHFRVDKWEHLGWALRWESYTPNYEFGYIRLGVKTETYMPSTKEEYEKNYIPWTSIKLESYKSMWPPKDIY